MVQSAMNEGDIAGRWTCELILKRDVFSTVERGRLRTEHGEVDAVLRRLDAVPWWSRPLAQLLFAREVRALKLAPPGTAPALLYGGRDRLVRAFIRGVPLHIAKPHGDIAYFRFAKTLLHALHRAGIVHNDLAKEQNWLRTADGRACMIDFQLAAVFMRRGKLFRIAAYEDLRHLLKHKRRYAPAAMTASERRVLARKSLITRVWMATGKKLYYAVTRGILNFSDREGGGNRLIHDAPKIAARLKEHPQVRDAAVVAYPDRRAGIGLYAFVEASGVHEPGLRDFINGLAGISPPERMQIVDVLPRKADGKLRDEILQLVAMNQIDLVDPLIAGDAERAIVTRIIAGRQNLRDRFAF